MPQNVIAAFACILSVDLMVFFCSVMFVTHCRFLFFFSLEFCYFFSVSSLTLVYYIGNGLNWSSVFQPLVSSHFSAIETRWMQTNKLYTAKYFSSSERKMRTIDCNRIYYLHCCARTRGCWIETQAWHFVSCLFILIVTLCRLEHRLQKSFSLEVIRLSWNSKICVINGRQL